MTPVRGRFAPSPTGRMHAGNIFASLMAWLQVRSQGGQMVLRIEDLDEARSKPHFIDLIQQDLELLGLTWDHGPYYQSVRDEAYEEAFQRISEQARLYPCFCTRADLAAVSAPHLGEKAVYPGTCRHLSPAEAELRIQAGEDAAWRVEVPSRSFGFEDALQGSYGQQLSEGCGDFILRRKDGAFAYQLAVVVDDASQGVTSVTRGIDLLSSTPQQMFLLDLLGYPHPEYLHVPLLVNEQGRRLSKRDGDASLEEMLTRFRTPQGIIGHIAFLAGLQPEDEPATPDELIAVYDRDSLKERLQGQISIPWE